jgi:uridine kinase
VINSFFISFLCRSIKVPSSRIVVIEGIYALSEKLRPLLDMRVAVTGGVHFDLVKRVLRDINRAGQDPEEIIQQISETVPFFYFCVVFSYFQFIDRND